MWCHTYVVDDDGLVDVHVRRWRRRLWQASGVRSAAASAVFRANNERKEKMAPK